MFMKLSLNELLTNNFELSIEQFNLNFSPNHEDAIAIN